MNKERLLGDVQKVLTHGINKKTAAEIVEVVEQYIPLRQVTLSPGSIKERGIMAAVALKAATPSDESEEDILKRADKYYIWLRVKQEVGMPKEVAKEVEKNPPF